MGIAEWIALTQLVIVPIGIAIWKTYRDDVKNKEIKEFIDHAVKAAEELSLSKQLKTSKQDYVFKLLDEFVPNLIKDEKSRKKTEMLIHAALQASGLGSSGKQFMTASTPPTGFRNQK